jgi:hypothetical protein
MITGGRLRSFINRLETWFTQAKTADADDQLQRLPLALTQLISQELPYLAPPAPYMETVRDQVNQALEHWQTNPEAGNSLVFLHSPIDDLTEILKVSLDGWQPKTPQPLPLIWPLEDTHRCPEPLATSSLLHNRLEPRQTEDEDQPSEAKPEEQTTLPKPKDALERRQTVMVIPALELYFLRCIQGWEGIEYLQNLIVQDRSRFWLMGCNAWGWTFLERVCQVGSYLERVEYLPKLDGDELQTWLHPLAERVLSPEKADDPDAPPTFGSESYWSALASLSSGLSATAAHLWVRSLRLRKENADELEPVDVTECDTLQSLLDKHPLELGLVKPTLPGLTSLEALDRYLLHALLMHQPMTRAHLAQSLGETERLVRTRIQVLQREGVIWQRGDQLTVNPIHYPKLRSELNNNSFLIGER